MQRRDALRTGISALSLSGLWAAGVLLPEALFAAWPSAAFEADDLQTAQRLFFGETVAETSDQIVITAPDVAENGRVVPVEVAIRLPEPTTLTLFSDGNPSPLLARARFTPAVESRLALRVKLGQSSNLIALVEADGKLYRQSRAVKVTAGGCGS
ncbi:MAG: thiosulfate oxidation carrier protein SoxY [Thiohalocapsa sp.]